MSTPELGQHVRDERQQRSADSAEPLYSYDMTLQTRGGSVMVTIPAAARKLYDVDTDDTQRVELHQGGLWIPLDDE